jgi:hypothetical protein
MIRILKPSQIGDALHPGSIAPIFKRVAQWIGMSARFVAEVSGHSTRVGAAQDLAELDIDLGVRGLSKEKHPLETSPRSPYGAAY